MTTLAAAAVAADLICSAAALDARRQLRHIVGSRTASLSSRSSVRPSGAYQRAGGPPLEFEVELILQ